MITTRTTDTTTGDPPGKDPQPDSGLYESCLENSVCDANTDGSSRSPTRKVCGYKCADTEDCPTGMDCLEIDLPDNTTGFFCF